MVDVTMILRRQEALYYEILNLVSVLNVVFWEFYHSSKLFLLYMQKMRKRIVQEWKFSIQFLVHCQMFCRTFRWVIAALWGAILVSNTHPFTGVVASSEENMSPEG